MFKRIRAWFERRRAERDAAEYERGRQWAHHEIIFGKGYTYVEDMTYGVWDAFDRGAHEALRAHAMNQLMLGRDVSERTQALALEHERYDGAFIDLRPRKPPNLGLTEYPITDLAPERAGDPDDLFDYDRALARVKRNKPASPDPVHVFRFPPKKDE